MPQQDMSSRLAKSPSPTIQSAVNKSANGQRCVPVPGIVKDAYRKQPVSVPVKK